MYKIFKRLLDIFIAVIALVILSPIFICVIIILLFTGERELFYRQERVGFKNRPFNILKFATMLKNSPNMGTGVITVRNDPRVTPFGKILRITKINELPQIFNVLKGNMSIVGPRPLVARSVELYPDAVKEKIYNSPPGMTGIGSLIFRDEENIISSGEPYEMYRQIYLHKGELELWYQRNASMLTDIKIIFLTAWCILFPKSNLQNKFFRSLPANPFGESHWSAPSSVSHND